MEKQYSNWIPAPLLELYLKGLLDFDDLRHHALIRNMSRILRDSDKILRDSDKILTQKEEATND